MKRRRDRRLICYTMVWRVKPVYQQMTLSPWLGAAGLIILWHIMSPLLTLVFISEAFSPRPLGIGMHFQTLLSPPLKVLRMVLLSSPLWWELGTCLPGHGPGEWLLFGRVTSKQFWFRTRLAVFVDGGNNNVDVDIDLLADRWGHIFRVELPDCDHRLRIDRTQHSLISANCVLVRIAEYGGISEKLSIIVTILTPNY